MRYVCDNGFAPRTNPGPTADRPPEAYERRAPGSGVLRALGGPVLRLIGPDRWFSNFSASLKIKKNI